MSLQEEGEVILIKDYRETCILKNNYVHRKFMSFINNNC